jgi:hypothetical protein
LLRFSPHCSTKPAAAAFKSHIKLNPLASMQIMQVDENQYSLQCIWLCSSQPQPPEGSASPDSCPAQPLTHSMLPPLAPYHHSLSPLPPFPKHTNTPRLTHPPKLPPSSSPPAPSGKQR